MTWLFNSGAQAAGQAAQTGAQAVGQQAATQAGQNAVMTGAVGQTGITGGTVTPVFDSLSPSANAAFEGVSNAAQNYGKSLYNTMQGRGSSGTGADGSGMNAPQSSGAGGVLHGMLSARKTQAPSSGTGEPPVTYARPRQAYQPSNNQDSIASILQLLFQR